MTKTEIRFIKRAQREIERKIAVYSLIFRRIWMHVIADQEARFFQRLPLIISPTAKSIMILEEENHIVGLAMRPVYITAATQAADELLEKFNVFVKAIHPSKMLNQKLFDYADKYSAAMAKHMNKTTTNKIKKVILDGYKKDLTYSQIAKTIKTDVFKDLAQGYRAKLVARTEAHGMVENGSFEAAKASNVVKEKTWSAAGDARETHGIANGQTVLITDTFVVGGYQMNFPGDTSYGADLGEIIHCRCSALYSAIIHKDRLTNSKDLLARYQEQQAQLKPLDALKLSDANLEQLEGEMKLNNMMFDQANNLESAAMTKNRIVKELAEKLKDNKDFIEYVKSRELIPNLVPTQTQIERAVNTLIKNWAGTSGDANTSAIAMQMAAQKEFGLTNATLKHLSGSTLKEAKIMLIERGKAYQAFLRAQYNLTQAYLKKNGITSLTGYRGMAFNEPVSGFQFNINTSITQGKFQLQSLSSFSTDSTTAAEFTMRGDYRMILQTKVPINRILSTCQTGYGAKAEAEFVILGGMDDYKIISYLAKGENFVHGVLSYPITSSNSDALALFADFKVVPTAIKPIASKVLTRGHLRNMSEERQIEQIIIDAKAVGKELTYNQAATFRDGINEFTSGTYKTVREYQAGGIKEIKGLGTFRQNQIVKMSKDIEEYLKFAPKYEGQVMRNIAPKTIGEKTMFAKLKTGNIVDMKGTSFWTSSDDVSSLFGDVQFVVNKPQAGVSISHLSSFKAEGKEILFGNEIKFKVTSVKEVMKDAVKYQEFSKFGIKALPKRKVLQITLEEIIPI